MKKYAMLIIQSQFTGSELSCILHTYVFSQIYKSDWPNLSPSFQCGNAVARIRVNWNISSILTFRFAGIRVGGITPCIGTYQELRHVDFVFVKPTLILEGSYWNSNGV
jgi:hypothetical protein